LMRFAGLFSVGEPGNTEKYQSAKQIHGSVDNLWKSPRSLTLQKIRSAL
jgi:hypothetical protein